mmetsp:Transcript_31184/g.87439  ORF Transcript_31184/g.87439 Transcript_31184/m.87439 type:complete len:200 (-) Transcript_31184:191-790(-)
MCGVVGHAGPRGHEAAARGGRPWRRWVAAWHQVGAGARGGCCAVRPGGRRGERVVRHGRGAGGAGGRGAGRGGQGGGPDRQRTKGGGPGHHRAGPAAVDREGRPGNPRGAHQPHRDPRSGADRSLAPGRGRPHRRRCPRRHAVYRAGRQHGHRRRLRTGAVAGPARQLPGRRGGVRGGAGEKCKQHRHREPVVGKVAHV